MDQGNAERVWEAGCRDPLMPTSHLSQERHSSSPVRGGDPALPEHTEMSPGVAVLDGPPNSLYLQPLHLELAQVPAAPKREVHHVTPRSGLVFPFCADSCRSP